MSGNILIQNYHSLNGAMILDSSNLNITAGADVTFFNNSALNSGGALLLIYSNFYIEAGASVNFINNSANDQGGAIFVSPGIISESIYDITIDIMVHSKCLFQLMNSSNSETYISFANNSAVNGRDDIYGATLENCQFNQTGLLRINRSGPSNHSSVSSDPQHVCLCDNHGVPQCKSTFNNRTIYPGENFTVPVVLVGWDYPNTTIGVIYTNFLHSNNSNLDLTSQKGHVISNSQQCNIISLSLYVSPNSPSETKVTAVHVNTQTAHTFAKGGQCFLEYPPPPLYCNYKEHFTPVFFNITILPCPAGFIFIHQSCDCYLHYTVFDSCYIVNGAGYFM